MKYSVLNMNVNGINTLIPEIHLLLTSHWPVIAVLTDIRLTGSLWFHFQGYKLYHTPSRDMAGGVICPSTSQYTERTRQPDSSVSLLFGTAFPLR